MAVMLFLLALASLAGGVAAAFFGSDILLADRGLPMIIAGATVAAAGLVLLGLASVAYGMKRLERRLASLGSLVVAAPAAPVPAAAPGGPRPERDMEVPVAPVDPDAPELPLSEPPRVAAVPQSSPDVTVIGRYASGGNSYVMFSDGSIDAETPAGRHRFTSLDDLRAFVSAGGERGEPS